MSTGGTVLLVEDEPLVLDCTRRLVEREGWRVISASTYEDALGVLQSGEALQLVISDFDLRDQRGDGLDICVLAQKLRPDSTRIMYSGSCMSMKIRDALRCGTLHSYIPKPDFRGLLRYLAFARSSFRREDQAKAP